MFRSTSVAFLAVFTLLLAACSDRGTEPAVSVEGPDSTESAEKAHSEGIHWYKDSIDEAFASAKAQNKPLFLYWGAEWCPYCHELKATIFIRDEFIALSRQFIALDMSNGNAENIRYADKFKIYGLPTVIVFNPEGQELTRIAGGMDIQQYASVLELTLNALRPVAQLVATVQAGEALSDSDWELLAGYSWSQDRGRALGDQQVSKVLNEIANACPAHLSVARSRLQMAALGAWFEEEEETRESALAQTHLGAVESVLANASLSQANLTALAYLGTDAVNVLASGERQQQLQSQLVNLFQAGVENADFNVLKRATILSGWSEVVTALLADGQSLAQNQVDWGKAQADALLATLGPYQTHAGVNSLWGVYYEVGLEADARNTLLHGIKVSKAPYYFMSGMAYIERKAENTEAALDWYRKAWETTKVPMHRARWGGGYVSRLVSMSPESVADIRAVSAQVLQEILSQNDGLQNYKSRLERMNRSLLEWSKTEQDSRAPVLAGLRAQIEAVCSDENKSADVESPCTQYFLTDV